jgi:glycosyltransferase involved in cell wall biosynthesis
MSSPLLICPGYFDQRLDGIGRVTGAFATAMEQIAGRPPYILSANDPADSCLRATGRCFGRNYRQMLTTALLDPRGFSSLHNSPEPVAGVPPLPIICTHLGLSPVARILAARTGRPYFVFIHGVEGWKPLKVRARWGLKGTARLLVNSHYTLSHFLAHNPWARDLPATVIPLGVPVEGFDALTKTVRKSADPHVILTVGRMSKAEYYEAFRDPTDLYKGFKSVVEAVALLRKAGVPAVLELVGDGNARSDLEEWVAKQSVSPFVNFLGRVSDPELDRQYARAEVFVLASEGEGFGLVYAEAMAHGLPCIGVAAGAAPEVITNDESGYVVRARDSQEIADRLFVLLGNPLVYDRLSRGAAARHRTHYTQRAFIARIVAALSSPVRVGQR